MNTLFKKSLIFTAFVFLSAGAIAKEISNDTIYLKWGGVAPRSSTYDPDKGFCINTNQIDPAAGKLTFTRNTKDNTKVDIIGSTIFFIGLNPYDSVKNECITNTDMPFNYKNERLEVVITDENGVPQEVNKDNWNIVFWDHTHIGRDSSTGYMNSKYLNAINEFDKMQEYIFGVSFLIKGEELDVGSGVWAQVRAYLLIEPDLT